MTYGNHDPELSKKVLKEIVDRYFEKHLEIHRSAAAFDLVAKQTEEVRERLKQTEKQLNKLRTESGILSLADATSALSSQRAKTQEDLMKAKADFAEQQANIESLEKASAVQDESTREDRPGNANPPMAGRPPRKWSILLPHRPSPNTGRSWNCSPSCKNGISNCASNSHQETAC